MTITNPARLVEALRDAGWQVAGAKQGVYVRLAWPGAPNRSLLIPIDQTAPEFEELLRAAVSQLEQAAATGRDAAQALAMYRPDLYIRHY